MFELSLHCPDQCPRSLSGGQRIEIVGLVVYEGPKSFGPEQTRTLDKGPKPVKAPLLGSGQKEKRANLIRLPA